MTSPPSRLVYDGPVFIIEFYVAPNRVAPAEEWIEQLPLTAQQRFAALFARMGDQERYGTNASSNI
jgi:hypothetical protein